MNTLLFRKTFLYLERRREDLGLMNESRLISSNAAPYGNQYIQTLRHKDIP